MKSFRTNSDIKHNFFAFIERAKSLTRNTGIMNEDVSAISLRKKSISLYFIEPLNFSNRHQIYVRLYYQNTCSRGTPQCAPTYTLYFFMTFDIFLFEYLKTADRAIYGKSHFYYIIPHVFQSRQYALYPSPELLWLFEL